MTAALIGWGPAALWAGVLFLLSSLPDSPGGWTLPVSDKIVHFVMFAVLGGLLAWGGRRSRWTVPLSALVVIGVLYGALDEWHQSFVVGRDASLGDFVADALGVGAGALVVAGYPRKGGALSP